MKNAWHIARGITLHLYSSQMHRRVKPVVSNTNISEPIDINAIKREKNMLLNEYLESLIFQELLA